MRPILVYLLLVGIPALGLSALMRLGRRLTAPISVAGTWSVQSNGEVCDGCPCVNPFANSVRPVLTITQSGTYLLVKLNDEEGNVFAGRIYGPDISAEVIRRTGTALIASAHDRPGVILRAAVDRRIEPELLSGELNFVDRPSCANIAFTARRDKVRRIEGR